MTFLQPLLLLALPLAALPVIIHLIHLYRRRPIEWAAMMFLRMAQRMNKGLSRLRQVLILTLRVLAVAAILLVICRPLAGGWLGLTGGAPDTVIILLDRSASMEQVNPSTGVSKRLAGLRNLSTAIESAVGSRSRLVLIDSALALPQQIDKASAMLDLPQTGPTETAADIPRLLQAALDYISTNKSGRTDVWMVSDLQQSDWDSSGGRWESLREAFGALKGVRFHLLTYPELATEDLGVTIDRVVRREAAENAELLFDLKVAGSGAANEAPVRFVINGVATTMNVTLKDGAAVLQGHSIAIDKSTKRGWGRIELPSDALAANNAFHFVFDEPPVMRSVVVSADETQSRPIVAALSAPLDGSRKYHAEVLSPERATEIPWEDTALIVWQAPIPKPDDLLSAQLKNFVASGRTLLFLPPEHPDTSKIFGLGWGTWETLAGKTQKVEWWRNDADLLANTRDGTALPAGELEITRRCTIVGEGIPLARVEGNAPLLVRATHEQDGQVYFLGTLPDSGSSSLARDGVVMFALLHRAMNTGATSLGKAQQRIASQGALGTESSKWRAAEEKAQYVSNELPLRAGVVVAEDRIAALNRPSGEDQPQTLSPSTLSELFAGLDFRVIADNLEQGRSLTNEVWRTFLTIMALALLGEALLCLPPRRETTAGAVSIADGFAKPEPEPSLPR